MQNTATARDTAPGGDDREAWRRRYESIRAFTLELAAPLTAEDQQVQTMPDVSPTKWHLAHVTWFWETFLLKPRVPGYTPFHPRYEYLFNSYYVAVGPRHGRDIRGLLTRPPLSDVLDYRRHVDAEMVRLIEGAGENLWAEIAPLVDLGLHHEQQHQELILTDVKHVLALNPLAPAYRDDLKRDGESAPALAWHGVEGGVREIGHDGRGFAFDNEGPRHRVFVDDFRIASRLVTNGEYLAFVEDDGYQTASHWLWDGWLTAQREGWTAPIYWCERDGAWSEFTLAGEVPLDPDAPVTHLSCYEAAAYASWAGCRLPTEAEWEVAADAFDVMATAPDANLLPAGRLHPAVAPADCDRPQQMIGDVWEWTSSAYAPYPGFRAAAGAVGEYNGKFMCNQMVLRGGSCATPPDHIRPTYRNFFYPPQRWQFMGVRLADQA